MAELYVESLLQDGKQALDDREVSEGLENIPIDPEGNHASEVPEPECLSNNSGLSISVHNVSSLRLFLHQKSKLHSLKDEDIHDLLYSFQSLNEKCTSLDLKSIIRWLKSVFDVKTIGLTGKKIDLVNKIFHCVTSVQPPVLENLVHTKSKLKKVKSLWDICANVVNKFAKSTLNVIVAHHTMISEHEKWKSESHVSFNISNFPNLNWCYVPELHPESKQLLLSFLDPHHLNIRLRIALIRDKLTFVSYSAWKKVSEVPGSPLPIPIVNGADPQSENFARVMFSVEVQNCLSVLGFLKESRFCHLVRDFMLANDEPGIPAINLHQMRLALRNFLLEFVDIYSFPTSGDNICGMPFQLFEAIISLSDAFLQLHSLTPSNAYNVRSISTNDNETLHGIEEAMLKPFGEVPSAKQLQIVKAKTMEVSAILNDPSIDFPIRHAVLQFIDTKPICLIVQMLKLMKHFLYQNI